MRYVESLSDARTKPGKGRVLARLGNGGCNTVFFNILLGGLVRKRRKPRQLLAFQKLQRRAATGGDERHVFGFTGAVHRAGESENMSFISTGGGATLQLLEGKEMPGLAALPNQPS